MELSLKYSLYSVQDWREKQKGRAVILGGWYLEGDFCFTRKEATYRLSRSYEEERENLPEPKGNQTASVCIQDGCE